MIIGDSNKYYYYYYLPNINIVEKMDELQKLNMNLIAILDKYFSTNIWVPDLLEN